MLVCPGDAQIPSFEYGVRKSLTDLGHNVSVFDYRQFQLHRLKLTNTFLNSRLVKFAKNENPDLVLVLKGEQLQKKTIEKISDAKIKTANWIMDDPFGKQNTFNKLKNINEYDDFFVFDPYYIKELKECGQPNSHYLPCCTNINYTKRKFLLKKENMTRTFHFLEHIRLNVKKY